MFPNYNFYKLQFLYNFLFIIIDPGFVFYFFVWLIYKTILKFIRLFKARILLFVYFGVGPYYKKLMLCY